MEQTPIDWLLDKLPIRYRNAMINTCANEIKEAKERQKEAFKKFYNKGSEDEFNGAGFQSFENYYNELYND